MVSATTVVGIDVSREWLDGFCLPDLQRFRLANSPEGHENLILMIRQMPAPIRVGFEATGRQEWAVWTALGRVSEVVEIGWRRNLRVNQHPPNRRRQPPGRSRHEAEYR